MSNIIVNPDISENSSFVSNLSKLSKLSKSQKPQTVVPSKISVHNNNIQHDKSSFISKFTRLSPKPTVLNDDMSDNSSLVSNLTRLSQSSKKNPALKSEPEAEFSFQRSVASSVADTKLSVKQIPVSSNSTTSNINYDDEIASNVHSENSTHISVYSSENSYKQSINKPINNKPINNTPINNTPINNTPINNTPINNKPINNKPINNTPINNTPINNTPINNTPINNTPIINKPNIVTNSNNSIIQKQDDITNRVVIDVAVLCQEYTTIDTMCHDNIINLDEIPITKEVFQSIFYPYQDNFGLNKDFVNNNIKISSHISFIPEFRSVNSKKFYLLEEIISNIERDLNISRNCFTKESLVELTNEIISIKSLCDINCCSVLSSLSWKNILEIIKNYKLINYCQCEKRPESAENYCQICKTSTTDIIPICVVNIIFKTPTPGVKNTIIRFNYRITNL
jgi:hypothetical protein